MQQAITAIKIVARECQFQGGSLLFEHKKQAAIEQKSEPIGHEQLAEQLLFFVEHVNN
jgi:hypothetical protein